MYKTTLDLHTLYNKMGLKLERGKISVTVEKDNTYYDLYTFSGELVCCDGEEVIIIDMDKYFVTLLGNDSKKFKLTKEEFEIATENSIVEEHRRV